MEKFAPTVHVPGLGTYQPPGWMWVLGFALGGCEWAIREAGTEAFRETARQWYRDRKRSRLADYVVDLEEKLAEARCRLAGLDNYP